MRIFIKLSIVLGISLGIYVIYNRILWIFHLQSTEVNMYIGYIDDTLFKKKEYIAHVDNPYPNCVIDRTIGNYFHKNIKVLDPREERLQLGGKVIKDQLSFHYDKSKHETDFFDSLPNSDLAMFFNIVEMIFTANGDSSEAIDFNLKTNNLTKEAYVPNTLSLSKKAVTGTIYNIDGLTPTTEINLVTFFSFNIKVQGKDETTFRIFLNRESFLKDYPLSTINRVILPCDKIYILDPSKISGTVEMMIKSNKFSFKDLDESIITEDHSGLLTFYTKYITPSMSAIQLLPFGILYQGAKPSSLEIREAIRNELKKDGIAEDQVWESILPDLFVTAQFFIIPIWDNKSKRSFGTIYPSIINAHKYQSVISELFPNLSTDYIRTNQEMITCGQSELFLTTIPDPLNKEKFSLLKEHPSYQYHMSQDGAVFTNMDPLTQDFNKRLNRAMAVACGETIALADVSDNTIDERLWHSFSSNKVEYHILSRSSYYTTLNITDD